MSARWPNSLLALALFACGEDPTFKCGSGIDQRAIEGWAHVDPPATVSYRDNPPASGDHYPIPAPWGVAPSPVPREQWVHNLEHGGIVMLYNCPDGCDDDVQAMTTERMNRPVDLFHEVRMLIAPDSLMPHKLAAIAWGWRWQADVFDVETTTCFTDQRYDKGRESIP